MNALEKRMFFLMLSVKEGQYYAQEMGFPPPSEEVQEIEKVDVLTRWGVFITTDVYNEIMESAKWVTDFLKHFEKLKSDDDDLQEILTVFGVALLNRLIDSEKVIIMLDDILELMGDDNE
jgi:hypothetical protein